MESTKSKRMLKFGSGNFYSYVGEKTDITGWNRDMEEVWNAEDDGKNDESKADKILANCICETCFKFFENNSVLQKHRQTHEKLPTPCGHCEKVFDNNIKL